MRLRIQACPKNIQHNVKESFLELHHFTLSWELFSTVCLFTDQYQLHFFQELWSCYPFNRMYNMYDGNLYSSSFGDNETTKTFQYTRRQTCCLIVWKLIRWVRSKSWQDGPYIATVFPAETTYDCYCNCISQPNFDMANLPDGFLDRCLGNHNWKSEALQIQRQKKYRNLQRDCADVCDVHNHVLLRLGTWCQYALQCGVHMHNLYFIASCRQLCPHRKVNLSKNEDDFDVEVCPKKIQEG